MPEGMRELRPGVWELRLELGVDQNGKRRQKSVTFHGGVREAKAKRAELLVQHAKKTADGKTTFAELLDDYLVVQQRRRSPTTVAEYERIIDRRLKPELGKVTVERLTTRHFDELFRRLATSGGRGGRPLAPATVRQVQAVARGALKQAVRWGWLATNPAALATTDPVRREHRELPTVPDLQRLALIVTDGDPDMARLLWVTAALGARRGEVCGLRWRHLDIDTDDDAGRPVDGVIQVQRNVVVVRRKGRRKELVDKETKTYERRKVEIDVPTVAILRGHRAAVLERLRLGGQGSRLSLDAYVFSRDPRGRDPLDPDLITGAWRRARAKAGVATARFHDLRHLNASLLIAAGYDPAVVADRLGHATPYTTLAVYGHMMPGKGRAAADELGRLLHGAEPAELGHRSRAVSPGPAGPSALTA